VNNGPTWNRPPESFFQVAIEDKDYLQARGDFVKTETHAWLFGESENQKKIDALISKVERLQVELNIERKKVTDQYYWRIYEDYQQWKAKQN